MVAELACSRLRGNSRVQDHIVEAARRTLVLFAGAEISALINQELESEHFWVRHGGLNWAWVRGDEGTIDRLAAIARRPIARDASGKAAPNAWQEFSAATKGLAALGGDEVLVEIFSNPELVDVPQLPLAEFRAHRGPMSKSLTERAVCAMRNTKISEDALRCSLVIAWLSGDTELIPDVRNVLDRVEPESRVALHACIALEALGDGTAEFARMAERLAFTKENGWRGLAALIGLEGEGVEGLRRWLDRMGDTERIEYRELVIRALYASGESRNDAIEAAVEMCLKNPMSLRPVYEIAAESQDLAVREGILEQAFVESSVIVRAPLDAMRGLAKYDTDRATEAIELGLSNHPKLERELCRLLVQVAPESAAEKLVGASVAAERDSLSDAVGRALRRLDPKAVADAIVDRLRGTETERKVVCRIAGWLPIPEIVEALETVADRESAITVRRSGLEALYRHREEEAIRGLFLEFRAERCAARRWAFFVAILEGADPYLLTDEEDSLWLGGMLAKDVPYAFEHYAREVLKRRKQKK